MMLKILVVIFAMTTVVCAVGWICRKISVLMLLTYLFLNEYKPPDDKDLEACRKIVVDQIVEDFFNIFKFKVKESK